MPRQLFSRSLAWLYGALDLQESEIPHHLDTDRVVPVLDVGQGGWATASWRVGTQNQPASTAANNEVLAQELDERTSIVHSLSISHFGGAGASIVPIRLFDPVRALYIHIARPSIPAASTFSWLDISGGIGPLIVPPGHRLEIAWPATAVGESFEVYYLVGSTVGRWKPL